ncbi:MAG: MogA/MoaB family molybdenum cofactor biosynthesis protein [Chloroflexi bacterium]|nr:MogA/MoaB family molybdenum cofactor biosynthesis protein [Chloroflexota bacterium]
MSSSYHDHQASAAENASAVPCAVITVSDTRTVESDTSGQIIQQMLRDAGHTITAYHIVKDDPHQIGLLLDSLSRDSGPARVILINGGTGISPRDRTYDVVSRRLQKTLPGFGELFRMLSFEEIGAAAMLSRAVAGVYRNRVILSMPGSTNAVKLAMQRLILPQIQHLAWEVTRD